MKYLLLLLFVIFSATAEAQMRDIRSFRSNADQYGSKDPALFGHMLARQYNVNESAIGDLLTRFDNNWGDLALGLQLSNLSKKPLNTVAGAYEKNQGWGNIAKELGIKPGSAEFHQMKSELRQRKAEWSQEWDKKSSTSKEKSQKKAKKSASKSKAANRGKR